MRWVNEALPPRPRLRWLLMTMRLSMSSLAGTDRTLVAVGTVRLAIMFVAVRADAPRSRRTSASGAGGPASADGAAGDADGADGAVSTPEPSRPAFRCRAPLAHPTGAGSRRRSSTTPCPPSRDRPGSAGRAHPRAIRWYRSPRGPAPVVPRRHGRWLAR